VSLSHLEQPGIVARWRIREDEVQVNQALAAVCQDPAVAGAFVRTVLDIASSDAESGRQAATALKRVPEELRCEEQGRLPEQRRRALLRERRHIGIVDLHFSDNETKFRLIVELKINADPHSIGGGQTQLDSYVRAGPVVAIARKPLAPPDHHRNNWLGTVSWKQLDGRLEALPIASSSLREEWLELLAVMRDDGDFEDEAPKTSRSTQDAIGWLEANKSVLARALADATAASRRNGSTKRDRTTFANAIKTSKVSAGRDSAAIAFRPPVGSKGVVAGPIWIVLVPAYAASPRATVIWWPPRIPSWWKRADRIADAAAHRQLEASEFLQHPTNWSYRFITKTPAGQIRDAGLDELLPELTTTLQCVGKSGVLKVCLDSWLRGRKR
jgi:hypothetical protein